MSKLGIGKLLQFMYILRHSVTCSTNYQTYNRYLALNLAKPNHIQIKIEAPFARYK